MARIYDLTPPLRAGFAGWPGDPAFAIAPALTIAEHGAAVSRLTLGTHTGAHVDAPAHLIPGGATAGELPLAALIGPAWVAAWPGEGDVTAAGLEEALGGEVEPSGLRLLIKTRNSARGLTRGAAFDPAYIALAADAAAWLAAQGALLVGVDAPSVDRFDAEDLPAHRALLEAGVVLLEGLDLAEIPPGAYTLCALPLALAGADGAPARVIMIGA